MKRWLFFTLISIVSVVALFGGVLAFEENMAGHNMMGSDMSASCLVDCLSASMDEQDAAAVSIATVFVAILAIVLFGRVTLVEPSVMRPVRVQSQIQRLHSTIKRE